ncbi:phosphoribosylformylglycinamidine synthase I [Candidatus Woesearchaeota archaeon]|nr:phosphoribosylformylglycinamidine synthase I [Candidatus Woesearchaeota archaeon]
MVRIAVVWFAGQNCEEETKRALEAVGLHATIVRWNDPATLSTYDGYVIPGGWSYEDRVRAGVIAAKDPVMDILKQETKKGKPLFGICNGAQIVVESGLIPGTDGTVKLALAPNRNPKIAGYYCTWVRIISEQQQSAASCAIKEHTVLPLPVAHGEGRFVSNDPDLFSSLAKHNQIVFRYCDETGNALDEFPINPNGSTENVAGLCNREGNIVAFMPHPERSTWWKQLPEHEGKSFKETEQLAPASAIFASLKQWITKKK